MSTLDPLTISLYIHFKIENFCKTRLASIDDAYCSANGWELPNQAFPEDNGQNDDLPVRG